MYTVYAFGNGYLLYGMFQAIALFFKNNNIGVLFTILALIAAIYYAIRVTIYHQHSLLSTAKYVIVFSIILTGLVYNQTTVIINDVSNPAAPTNAQPISNVPWGIAVLWSDFTTIQYGLAKDFTNDFSVPAGDNMLSEGLGVSIIQQADSATISTSNSYLYQDYNQYISNCVAPGISAGYLDVSELLGAGDATDTASQTYNSNAANSIWTVMSTYTSNTATGGGGNLLTEWYSGSSPTSVTETASGQSDPGGTTTTCSQETTWLQTAVQDYITNNAGPAIAGGLQMASFSDLSNAIGAVNPYIFNMQQGGQAQLMQAIGVNMYAPAILKMAQASDSNASSLAVATGTGVTSTKTGMMESGILAGKYMPIVFGIFEAILLGASVIIFILILTHMGVSYLKLLFQLMIMITIWPSLTAIFNYITQLIIQAQYQPIAGLGYSVSGSGTVNSFLATSLSWMGYFSWSVPMVAYMIASGSSYAVASVVGGMDSAISKNASVKGAEAGLGNMTAGQIKDNIYLANGTNVTNVQNTGYRARNFTNEHGANTGEQIIDGMKVNTYENGGHEYASVQAGSGATATLEKGSDGWGFTNVSSNMSANERKALETDIKTNLTHEERELNSRSQSVTKASDSIINRYNKYEASQGNTSTSGHIQTVKVFNSTKNGQNTTTAHNTTTGKNGTVGLEIDGIGGAVTTGSSHSVNSAHTTATASGVARNTGTLHQDLATIASKHIAGISNDARHELSQVNRLEQTESKIKDLKQELGEVQTGTMGVTGGVTPAFLNATHTGKGGLSNFVGQFSNFVTDSKHLSTMAPVLQQMANFGDKSAMIPGVNAGINAGGKVLHSATSSVPTNISGQVKHAQGVINGNFNNNGGNYVNLNNAASNAYNLPLPSIGSVGEPTGATSHWVNKEANPAAMQFLQNNDPFAPGFNGGKKDFINTGVDQGLGIVDGVAVSTVGVFSQSGAGYLYNQFKQGGKNLSNPGAFNEGLNLTSYGDINLNSFNNSINTGFNIAKGQMVHPFGLTAPGQH
ncbi:MAG: conjugal transfer protein TraG [Candidatus Acidulodesulfobacterium acidiphilum]|uniref:Conjugal transfer protein TraG n=1 Tax=Candidatus Acidulodesulfobacterium acidiphilum TaxID=2597224 RepID=A0A520XG47_9DELT|nr:MAG: conjugal transfer protein TraG [Candidatus Acidulodesulfobacterium acidiphilum]